MSSSVTGILQSSSPASRTPQRKRFGMVSTAATRSMNTSLLPSRPRRSRTSTERSTGLWRRSWTPAIPRQSSCSRWAVWVPISRISQGAPTYRSSSPRALPLDWQAATRYREWWPQMQAFAIPSFYDGRIRVNLRGRERDGVVDPSNYETVLEELESLIRACQDPHTGEPAAATIERSGISDPALLQGTDADLMVVWNRSLCGLEHPEHGLIGPVPFRRTGGHTGPFGFAVVVGNRAEVGDHGVRSAFDVAPTVVDLVGGSPLKNMDGRSLLSVPIASRVR